MCNGQPVPDITTSSSLNHNNPYHLRHHLHITKKKRLERLNLLARTSVIAIVTHKLMLLTVCVLKLYVCVAKFAVYFHRKEFRRKKPHTIDNFSLFHYYILSN